MMDSARSLMFKHGGILKMAAPGYIGILNLAVFLKMAESLSWRKLQDGGILKYGCLFEY
jgi:hypothetical protein